MSLESTAALAAAIFVLAVTPGPGVFAVVARALAEGLRATLPFVFGIILGDLVYLVLAALGLSVIATRYTDVFSVVKILGGLYLVYLGVQTWRAAKHADTVLVPPVSRHGAGRFLSGFTLTLGNPKAAIFYVAFLPAFLDLGALDAIDLVVAGCIVSVMLFCVLAGYAYLAARARTMFKSSRAVKNLHRGAGALMVGAGGAVAAS
jgi:threonine/homoserine/homoserine lactone efflux protein